MVPLARLERALPKKRDFESRASTNSATGAAEIRPLIGLFRSRRQARVAIQFLCFMKFLTFCRFKIGIVHQFRLRPRQSWTEGGTALTIRDNMLDRPHMNTAAQPHDTDHHSATARLKAVLADLERQFSERPSQQTASTPNQSSDRKSNTGASTNHTTGADTPPQATLGALIEALDERAYGMLLLLLALPCTLPFIYLLPQIVALPMLALAAQMALGREAPWLPASLNKRDFPIRPMQTIISKVEGVLGWIEKITHRRFASLSEGIGLRICGALLLIPCAAILVPLPMTNSVPGIGVALAAIGLVERDGLLILAGLTLGLIWVFLLVFLGAEAVNLVKEWLMARF